MSTRREQIDDEIRHLRKLESQLTDQMTIDSINALIADLEAEKGELERSSSPQQRGGATLPSRKA
jgi:hypothetical protein